MRYFAVFILAGSILLVCACKKTLPLQTNTLVGVWGIVNDSSYLAGTAIFLGGSQNYHGVAGDYYNFTADGHLYIKEGAGTDTATYSIVSGNQLKITWYYVNGTGFPNGASRGNFTVSNLTAHTVTLKLPEIITPDGAEYEEINLKR